MRHISKRERWLIVAAGTAILVFILMQYYVLPYFDSLAVTAEKIDIQSKRVSSHRRVLRGQDTVKAALEEAYKQVALMETGLLTSRTDALAGAEIQGLVKDLAVSRGMAFRRSDLLPVKNISPEYSKISTRIEVNGNIHQLADFLVSLESSQKILFVEEMRIAPVQMGDLKNKQIMSTLLISGLKTPDKSNPPSDRKS